MPDLAVATIMHAQQLGKFIEQFSEYVPKSETLFITQKLQLPIGLSVPDYTCLYSLSYEVFLTVFFLLLFLKFCQNATVQCAKYRQRLSPRPF